MAGDKNLFAAFIAAAASRRGLYLGEEGIEPLAGLDYAAELALKDKALKEFWRHHRLDGEPQRIVPSPKSRFYRTTSKRRVISGRGGTCLRFNGGSGTACRSGAIISRLEPEGHAAIFHRAAQLLSCNSFTPAAGCLSYLVIRGTYEEFFLVFNTHKLDRHAVNSLRELAGELQAADARVLAAFIYFDPSRSPYYLELERPANRSQLKRLFGPDRFRLNLPGFQFRVSILSFSQVNESMLPGLLAAAASMLEAGNHRLLDLFCGYGLFACGLGHGYREVIGVEASPHSVAAAVAHGRQLAPATHVVFRRLMIARGNLAGILPRAYPGIAEDVILDPPRGGVDAATMRAMAGRKPKRVLHIFCSADEIPAALAAWRECCYAPQRIMPLDMFPGTPGLEVLVLLARDR